MLDIESFFLCAGVPYREKAREKVKRCSLRFSSFLLYFVHRADLAIKRSFYVSEYEVADLYRFYRVLSPIEMEISHIESLLQPRGVYLSATQIEHIIENEINENDFEQAIESAQDQANYRLRKYGLTGQQIIRILGYCRTIRANVGA